MRRCTRAIGRVLGAGSLLLLPAVASADAASGAGWDHHHMRSNAAARWTPLEPRPIVIGTPSSSTSIGVTEQTLHISQQGWQPGGPTSFASPRPQNQFSGFSSSNIGSLATRQDSVPQSTMSRSYGSRGHSAR